MRTGCRAAKVAGRRKPRKIIAINQHVCLPGTARRDQRFDRTLPGQTGESRSGGVVVAGDHVEVSKIA